MKYIRYINRQGGNEGIIRTAHQEIRKCKQRKVPVPEFAFHQRWISITFRIKSRQVSSNLQDEAILKNQSEWDQPFFSISHPARSAVAKLAKEDKHQPAQ